MADIDFEEIGYDEIRRRVQRGDYHDQVELKAVHKWLRARERERKYLAECERANIASALNASHAARRANLIALLALVISILSARDQVVAVLQALISYLVK